MWMSCDNIMIVYSHKSFAWDSRKRSNLFKLTRKFFLSFSAAVERFMKELLKPNHSFNAIKLTKPFLQSLGSFRQQVSQVSVQLSFEGIETR